MFSALVPIYLQPSEFWSCDYEDLVFIAKAAIEDTKSRMRSDILKNRLLIQDLGRALKGLQFQPISAIAPMLSDEEIPKKDWKRDKQNLMAWVEAQSNAGFNSRKIKD